MFHHSRLQSSISLSFAVHVRQDPLLNSTGPGLHEDSLQRADHFGLCSWQRTHAAVNREFAFAFVLT
jgi:hypothetical protein